MKKCLMVGYWWLVRVADCLNNLLERQKIAPGKLGGGKYQYNRSYSQHGEDVAIYFLFKNLLGMESFTYIDIGAHHPYEISNTAFMYEKGCHGINVEANPILFEEFPKTRKDDINVCCGVGSEEKTMDFYMVDDWSGRNSFSKSAVDEFVKAYPEFSIHKVIPIEVHTLKYIIDKYNQGIMPDYMSIDVEEMEYAVLSCFDMKAKGPKVVTCEEHEVNRELLDNYFQESGYFLWAHMGGNYTWVRNEYSDFVR